MKILFVLVTDVFDASLCAWPGALEPALAPGLGPARPHLWGPMSPGTDGQGRGPAPESANGLLEPALHSRPQALMPTVPKPPLCLCPRGRLPSPQVASRGPFSGRVSPPNSCHHTSRYGTQYGPRAASLSLAAGALAPAGCFPSNIISSAGSGTSSVFVLTSSSHRRRSEDM